MNNKGKISNWFEQSSANEQIALINLLQIGDLIEIRRKGYAHWAVYIGKDEKQVESVVNRQGPLKEGFSEGEWDIKKDSLEYVWGKSRARINNKYDHIMPPFDQNEIKDRALKAVDDEETRKQYKKYNLFQENCEAFAKRVRNGNSISKQAHHLLTALVVGVYFGFGPIIQHVHFLLFSIVIALMAAAVEVTKVLSKGYGLQRATLLIAGLALFTALKWLEGSRKVCDYTVGMLIFSALLSRPFRQPLFGPNYSGIAMAVFVGCAILVSIVRVPHVAAGSAFFALASALCGFKHSTGTAMGISALCCIQTLLNETEVYTWLTWMVAVLFVGVLTGGAYGFFDIPWKRLNYLSGEMDEHIPFLAKLEDLVSGKKLAWETDIHDAEPIRHENPIIRATFVLLFLFVTSVIVLLIARPCVTALLAAICVYFCIIIDQVMVCNGVQLEFPVLRRAGRFIIRVLSHSVVLLMGYVTVMKVIIDSAAILVATLPAALFEIWWWLVYWVRRYARNA